MNPYTSSGSVATMTANVSGNDNLNDLGDGPRQPGDPERYPVGAVTRRLMGYVRPHRISFVASFVSAAISVILQLYTPILIGEGIDLIVAVGQVDFDALLPLVTKLALVVVGAAAFQWLQGYCVNRLSYETVRDMRVEASDKLSRMPLSFIDSHPHGDLMSRVVNDVDQGGDGLLQGFTQLFTGVITIVGTLAFMLSINLTMTLVVVLVTPLSIFAAGAIAKLSNKSFTAQQRIQGQLGGHIEEYVGEQKLVDAFAYGPNAQQRFDALNAELYTAGERAQFMGSLSNPGTRFINNIIYAVVAVIGCVGVITGVPAALTVGGVQIFLSYANQYTKPFNEVTNVITQIQPAYASARRMFALLDAREQEPDAADAVELAAPQGEVAFEHVDFSYVSDRKLLQDICIEAKPGMRFALVGPTGCGRRRSSTCCCAFTISMPATSRLMAGLRVTTRAQACAMPLAWCCRIRGCSRARWRKTSPTAVPTPRASRLSKLPSARMRTSLSCSCQAATIRSSARTAARLARVKNSCCALRALCSPIRRFCCWTRQRRASIRVPSCRCRRHSTSSWPAVRALSWRIA